MRRKRLNHAAFTLCHMFCGWKLMNCYRQIAELGSGTLAIDVLSERCRFNGEDIPSLSIAAELQFWFARDLADNNIQADKITSATLTADLKLGVVNKDSRVISQYYFSHGKLVDSPDFFQCKIDCRSKIVTAEAEYTRAYSDIAEWPVDFALAQ